MRRNPALVIDVETDINAAKIGGVEPDLEATLAAKGRDCDLDRKPVQWHGRAGNHRDIVLRRRRGCSVGLDLRLRNGVIDALTFDLAGLRLRSDGGIGRLG